MTPTAARIAKALNITTYDGEQHTSYSSEIARAMGWLHEVAPAA